VGNVRPPSASLDGSARKRSPPSETRPTNSQYGVRDVLPPCLGHCRIGFSSLSPDAAIPRPRSRRRRAARTLEPAPIGPPTANAAHRLEPCLAPGLGGRARTTRPAFDGHRAPSGSFLAGAPAFSFQSAGFYPAGSAGVRDETRNFEGAPQRSNSDACTVRSSLSPKPTTRGGSRYTPSPSASSSRVEKKKKF